MALTALASVTSLRPSACRAARLALLALALGAGGLAAAAPHYSARAWSSVEGSDLARRAQVDTDAGSTPLRVDSGSIGNNTGGVATSGAWAEVGTAGIHLFTTSSAAMSLGPSWIYGSSTATASFADSFHITVPTGYAHLWTTATVAFEVSGPTSAVGSGIGHGPNDTWDAAAYWQAKLSLFAGGKSYSAVASYGRVDSSDGGAAGFGEGSGVYLVTLPMTPGETIHLRLEAEMWTSAGVGAGSGRPVTLNAGATADLGHTVAWKGIVSLVDADGQPVPVLAALSADTGFDYARAYVSPVPEAPVAALFAAGAALLAWRRRQR
jgi:hypothetical protein